jgi:hypothetical protein
MSVDCRSKGVVISKEVIPDAGELMNINATATFQSIMRR